MADDDIVTISFWSISNTSRWIYLEAFNEEGWGRQQWGNSGWGVEYSVDHRCIWSTISQGTVTAFHHNTVDLTGVSSTASVGSFLQQM